jgi:phosphopantothenoylcysteine decarboxylase / phosphopantothenate---cysteine ligase
MTNLAGRTIVLGVGGSIAAYKAAELTSRLVQQSVRVEVLMTEAATRFVAPLTFQSLSGRAVIHDMYDAQSESAEAHVAIARRADALVIAPATASTLARLAHGLADDIVSLTALATRAPILIAPAMDSQMYEAAATQANVRTLIDRGYTFVGPDAGRLASGQVGLGRLAEPETILGALSAMLGRDGDLAGRKVVVSAGGTREPIDPVRFIGNRSSGKMGFAIAEAARDRGAEVVLVHGAVQGDPPYGVRSVAVGTTAEMRDAVLSEVDGASALIMAAAPADFRAAQPSDQKIKRSGRPALSVELTQNPDIVAEASGDFVKVGFAAESEDLLGHARAKLAAKGLDLVVANDITAHDAGFNVDSNRVVLIGRDGELESLPLLSKYEVARHVLDRVVSLLADRQRSVAEAVATEP